MTKANAVVTGGARSAVHADAYLERSVGRVADGEARDACANVQRHVGDLSHVTIAVDFRYAADAHISIADCLHLSGETDNTW